MAAPNRSDVGWLPMVVKTEFLKASASILILALAIVLGFFLIGRLFEPMDTFARLYKTVHCSDESGRQLPCIARRLTGSCLTLISL